MLHAINVYVTITILPSVVAEIGGAAFYAWNTTLFILASIIGSVLSSGLLLRWGARTSYRCAISIFLLGTALCALSPSMPVLLVGRSIQGLGGGVLFALSYAMIQIVFRQSLWSRAMALVSSMWGAATLAGPALGGIFAELELWRGAFWILVAVGLPYWVLTERILPDPNGEHARPAPVAWAQIALLCSSVMAVSIASLSRDALFNAGGLVIAGLCTAALVALERRRDLCLLPQGSTIPGSPLANLYLVMALLVVAIQTEIFVPYFLQSLSGASPLVAGYLAALMAAGWAVAALLFSGLHDRNVRLAVVFGPLLVSASLAALAWLLPGSHAKGAALVPVGISLTLAGFGIGLTWPHLLARVLVVAPSTEAEKASAGITTLQLFATALGAAFAGLVVNAFGFGSGAARSADQQAAFWLFALFAAAPLIAAWPAWRVSRQMRGDGDQS
nr:MFS transporter [Qipengyuania qiaonensis]